MSTSSVKAAVDWALSRGQTCSEPVSSGPVSVSDAIAQNVISAATEDGVVEDGERAELQRFAREARIGPQGHAALQAALAMPRESADMRRRREQIRSAEELMRQTAATGSNDATAVGGVVGTILILDALFGRGR